MAPDPDPYRTLGLPRDATLDEVRRAYRRLAKANHPDAAGEAALPRFLAIQAAYDTIAGPDAAPAPAGRRPPGGPRRPGTRTATAPTRRIGPTAAGRDGLVRRVGRAPRGALGGSARERPPVTGSPGARRPPSRAATEQGDARLDLV